MHKNTHQPVIDAAVRASQDAILGSSGGGSLASGSGIPQRLTIIDEGGNPKHAFMIGFDAPGDATAGFFRDGHNYDFGT